MGQAFRYVLNETGQSNAVLVLKNFPTVFTVSPLPEWAGLVGKDVDRIFSNNSDISSVEGGKITVIKAVQGTDRLYIAGGNKNDQTEGKLVAPRDRKDPCIR